MKFLVVLAVAVACASAAVVPSDESSAPIVRSSSDSSPDGTSFNYAYETGNQIVAQAEGVVHNPNSDNPSLEIKGSYGYVAPDGTPVQTTYVAGENGFEAQGSHIPVAPPVPELIARALDYIAANPASVETKYPGAVRVVAKSVVVPPYNPPKFL